MQRTILVAGGGASNTYNGTGAVVTFYSPLSVSPIATGGANALTSPTGTSGFGGGYGRNNLSCVLSKLYIAVNKITTAAQSVVSAINVGGATPAAGNLSVSGGGAITGTNMYFYDATDVDAIAAGQQIGMQDTLNAASGTLLIPSRGVICDALDQALATPYMFGWQSAGNPVVWNTTAAKYSNTCGYSGFATSLSASQLPAGYAFVASSLQWQTAQGNSDTNNDGTCIFSHGPTLGSPIDTSLKATIQTPGTAGLWRDTTDISAVPAGDFHCLHWNTAGGFSGNTFRIANAGIHIQAASNNAGFITAWGSGESPWVTSNPSYGCFGQIARFDPVPYEADMVVPTSGVFSNLAVNVSTNSWGQSVSLNFLNGPASSDDGAHSGVMPGTGGNAPSPTGPNNLNIGYNTTNISITVPANQSGWAYDSTDVAAFVGGQQQGLLEFLSAGGSTSAPTANAFKIQGQTINFTAPAHLGLLTQGAG